MDTTMAHSIYTVVMFVIFIGIVIWAWSNKRKPAFREAANLPFADEAQEQSEPGALHREKETHHE
jgi:cytochrome c oxidase cbb3-type subunit 4